MRFIQPFVLSEGDRHLVLFNRGPQARWVEVVGDGTATRVSLLPKVALLDADTTPQAVGEAMVALVMRHRDALLDVWLKQLESAPAQPQGEAKVELIRYERGAQGYAIKLASGMSALVPARADAALAQANDEERAEVVVLPPGEIVHWPRLGLFRRAAELIEAGACAGSAGGSTAARAVPQAAAGTVRSLLGLILHRENYLTQAQLQAVFQEQQRLKQAGQEASFGQLAVQAGYVTPEQLQFAVHLQQALGHSADDGKPLGVYLLESAAVMPSQLLAALEENRRSGQRLGEVLTRRGLITEHALAMFLEKQKAGRQAAPEPARAPVAAGSAAPPPPPAPPASEPDPKATMVQKIKSLLGIILERENYLNQAQVKEVLIEQERRRQAGKKVPSFGELALEMGFITVEQLKFAVQLQTKLAYTPGKAKPLGFFLLENGVVKPSQIHIALEEQARTGKRLGEVLVEQGCISDSMLQVFLKMQKDQG